MKEKFNEKVIPVILKFINTKAIQSIKNGMVTSMSPLIIGSIFLILSNFPVKAVVDVLESTGIKPVLDQVCGATFSISALIAVIGISYSYAKLENQEPLNCGIISLATFLILMPSSITTEGGEVVSGIINKASNHFYADKRDRQTADHEARTSARTCPAHASRQEVWRKMKAVW